MKKVLCSALAAILIVSSVGCAAKPADSSVSSSSQSSEAVTSSASMEGKTKNAKSSATEDGITYTILSAKLLPVAGDRTADNVSSDNGEYFAKGSEIEKTSDWNELIITYSIDNQTDKAFGYFTPGWNITAADGYKIKTTNSLSDLTLNQVPSHSQKELELKVYVEKSLKIEMLNLEYSHQDYNQEYWDDFGKAISGELAEKEYTKKYGDSAKTLHFTVEVK